MLDTCKSAIERPGSQDPQQGMVPGDRSDATLVAQFTSGEDVRAFEAMLRRHGPMVLGVCRRLLRHEQDAEDAFQATFMVLHRKAHSIRATSRLGNWLYGVAYRTALKAKSSRHTMQTREMLVESLPEPKPATADEAWRGLEPVLDEELTKLPEKYRVAIVMCELEGMSLKEAANQLRLPEGTLSARLSRGRSLLRGRLSRRGVSLSVAALAAGLAQQASATSVETSLINLTIHGASVLASGQAGLAGACSAKVAALTKGVLKSMFISKLQYAGVAMVVATVVGTGVITAVQLPDGSRSDVTFAKASDDPQAWDETGTAEAEVSTDQTDAPADNEVVPNTENTAPDVVTIIGEAQPGPVETANVQLMLADSVTVNTVEADKVVTGTLILRSSDSAIADSGEDEPTEAAIQSVTIESVTPDQPAEVTFIQTPNAGTFSYSPDPASNTSTNDAPPAAASDGE